tara:strand:- start:170 stop:397 length:228 start_codon:yes stop_codon:yes gene_type:complete
VYAHTTQHRNFNGTAFDESEWASFRQLEASAVKGDYQDTNMSSTFLIFTVDDGGAIETIDRHWMESGTWQVERGR